MQEWVRTSGTRLVVVFEGRDAAGKGGAIQRITEYLNPRICRIVALPAPTERQRTQWYFQRYVEHLPAAGEIVLLDRSWYNRGGVERVMGFATPAEYDRFLRQCPMFEEMLIEDGILLRKYWFSVSDHEQEKRFRDRMSNPMKRWKLSPMDLQSITRWEDYSRAKDEMFAHTDTAIAVDGRGGRGQAPRPDQHDRAPAVERALEAGAQGGAGAAGPPAVEGLRAAAARAVPRGAGPRVDVGVTALSVARRIDAAERRARLAVRHRLVPSRRTDDVVTIADDLVALHSSDPVTVYLSVLARMANPALAAVEKALYDDRTLLRHHAMRRTLWVAGPETIRLAHAAATVDLHRVQYRMLATALSGAGVPIPTRGSRPVAPPCSTHWPTPRRPPATWANGCRSWRFR